MLGTRVARSSLCSLTTFHRKSLLKFLPVYMKSQTSRFYFVKICSHCQEAVRDIQIHLKSCSRSPNKACGRCGMTVLKAAFGDHLKNQCASAVQAGAEMSE